MSKDLAVPTIGRLLSVNVGQVRTLEWLGQTVTTGIWKTPVVGRVGVHRYNIDGDQQADRRAHGGPDKAVYAYAHEDAAWWAEREHRPMEYGNFGENLTIEGLGVSHAVVGEQWAIGTARFEVCQPRIPCYKLGARMGDPDFPPRFARAGRPGAYLRIIDEGEIGAGDEVHVVHRPAHRVTVYDIAYAYHDNHRHAARLLDAPEIAEGWRTWAAKQMAHQKM
jgi:MOSC domain-containing protein YiiM